MAAGACFLHRRPRAITRLSACLIWAQLLIAGAYWLPYIRGRGASGHIPIFHGFRIDPTASFFILLTTIVFSFALTHAVVFFDWEMAKDNPPKSRSISQIYIAMPFFLLAMYGVVSADNLGYLWISMEASTLLSAPLVYFHRARTSLEAAWKYLIICSVGIAFSFFGTALVFAASQNVPAFHHGSLSLTALVWQARALPHGELRLGFMFILLGYGVKAGLFPLHSWLPDAHSEAPAPASAILSGALLNCALVAIWRVSGLMTAAGQGLLIMHTLLPMGVCTVAAAALFLIKQRDIKRLLAYSSMENVGLMAVSIALGSSSAFALQAIGHSLIKVALFLMAGNLLQQYKTKKIRAIRGY
jgi:hydrogenase-4 component F